MAISLRIFMNKASQFCIVCLTLLSLPISSQAWAPSQRDLDAAIHDGDFAAYFTNLSAWLSQQVPADPIRISEEAMKPLLNNPVFVSALDQRQFMFKHGLAELEAFARANPTNQAFLPWLLKNRQALDLYLEGAVPVGIKAREQNSYKLSAKSLEIWKNILNADPEAKEGLYLRLTIATALRPPGTGNRGAGMQATPSDPVVRYQHFKFAHQSRELFPSFDRLTVWELQHVVSYCASESDLSWAREMINTWRPDLRKNEQVVNSTSEVKYGKPLHPFTDYKSVLSAGGQCGPRSSWSVMVCQAFGIPAIGVGQPGHACVAFKAADPASQPQPGSAWKVAYGRGWQVSKIEGLSGPDFLAGVEERSRAAEFSLVEPLRWLASALASTEQAAAVMKVAHAIQKSAPSVKTDLTASAKADEAEKELSPAKREPARTPSAQAPVTLGAGVTRVEAAGFFSQSGVRVLDCFTGGKQVNFEKNNQSSWIDYTFDVPASGTFSIELKAATPNNDQVLNLSSGTNRLAMINVPNSTGLWGTTPATDIRLEKGTQTLRISAPFQRGVALRHLELKRKDERR